MPEFNHPTVSRLYQINVLLLTLLLATLTLWIFVINPPSVDRPYIIWLVQIVPIAIIIPGVLKGNPRSFAWLCFIILLYFTSAVLNTYESPSELYGWIKLTLCISLFITAMMYVRCYYRLNGTKS
ncbi:DUF2069 domain-containing protein [Spartinivicinus poritis]|uniref:DUF2069 domain-containing protein n=1 Tax=Spartinivicinus poritis TaxID=2994640 RepID=A0ABT5U8P3_9GAMM|nr:DUF2069 domain-containing protein [Spartinivicinus sp. A2-2]MDE1462376.1 DUF2069 domain-containing protein [Spartinivicinus sp. A2-2]